jgi:hypothetical protein
MALQTTLSFLGIFLGSIAHPSSDIYVSKSFKSHLDICDGLVSSLDDAVKKYNGVRSQLDGLGKLQKKITEQHGFLGDAVKRDKL